MAKAKLYDPLRTARDTPEKVKHLALNPAAARNAGLGWFDPYATFPEEVLACTNLTSLEIFRGVQDGVEIPAAIGKLTKLTKLSLGGLGYTKLPETIGKLVNLVELELYYAHALTALPAAIGKLTKLRTLALGYCEALTTLPDAIGRLSALKVLNASNTALTSVPASLWKCTALEELRLPDSVTALPKGIGKLTKLRALSVSGVALASIASELPPSLRHLDVDGKIDVLPDLSRTRLVELHAGFLGLTALPPLPPTLTTLYVSGNKLTSIPVLSLPALTSLDFSDNPLPKADKREIDRLMKLPPKKRKAGKPAPAVAFDKPIELGKVVAENASLSMILGDAKMKWNADWERANAALDDRDLAPFEVAGKPALALSLAVGQGIAHAYKVRPCRTARQRVDNVGDRIVIVEGFVDDPHDELYLEWLASPPRKGKPMALEVPSKRLVAVSVTDTKGLTIPVGTSRVSVSLEPEAKGSWGHARRCHIVPS